MNGCQFYLYSALAQEQVLLKIRRCGRKLGLLVDEEETDLSNQENDEDFDV